MITKDQAVQLRHGDELWHITHRNADGTPKRVRVNGKVKTWKTRPQEFEIPMKYGMYHCFYINQNNAHEFVLPSEFDVTAFNRIIDGKHMPEWK